MNKLFHNLKGFITSQQAAAALLALCGYDFI